MPIDYRPPGAPRHAARIMIASPSLSQRARRALRLFATVGAWAAGLCLVIASIVLVAAAGTPHRASISSAANTLRAPGAGRASSGALAQFRGLGDASTRSFRIATARRWELLWTYTCRAGGVFVVTAYGRGALARPSVDQSGLGGSGVTWLNPDGRTHSLVVSTTCSWSIKVVQPG
jgi:hypothetical protein